MPPLDTWMVLTLRFPLIGTIVVLVLFISLIVFTTIWVRRKFRAIKALTLRVEELNTESESQSQTPNTSSVQDAYLQFTYNISHEVSNPLQSVQTNLENMADCSPEEIGRW